nr:hypothetical protein [Tanacetum cinerariifolium]
KRSYCLVAATGIGVGLYVLGMKRGFLSQKKEWVGRGDECPKNIGSSKAKNLKKPSQAPRVLLVGPNVGFKLAKQVYRPVSKSPNANTNGNKKKDVEPTKVVSYSSPFDVPNLVENDVNLGTNGEASNLASKKANSSGSSFWNV